MMAIGWKLGVVDFVRGCCLLLLAVKVVGDVGGVGDVGNVECCGRRRDRGCGRRGCYGRRRGRAADGVDVGTGWWLLMSLVLLMVLDVVDVVNVFKCCCCR